MQLQLPTGTALLPSPLLILGHQERGPDGHCAEEAVVESEHPLLRAESQAHVLLTGTGTGLLLGQTALDFLFSSSDLVFCGLSSFYSRRHPYSLSSVIHGIEGDIKA